MWLHHEVFHLVPTLWAAIAQSGFVNVANQVVWLKTMPDGTQRALILFGMTEDDLEEIIEDKIAFGNTIVIMQGNESQVQPSVIQTVTGLTGKNTSMWLSIPPDSEGPVMRCELIYNIESRTYDQFSESQRGVLELLRTNLLVHSQYLIVASQHHQHQLGMLIDTITSDYYTGIDKRLFQYEFKKESPVDLAVLEPLTRLGLSGDVLLNLSDDKSTYYYVVLDVVAAFVAEFFPAVHNSLSPWYIDAHQAGFLHLERQYNHPYNQHVKESIRELMKLKKLSKSYGINII